VSDGTYPLIVDLCVARFDLTDGEWAILEPLLPKQPRRGGKWRDHRQVINGIAWVKRTGSPWRDMPERYGPWKTAHDRFRRWAKDGTWAKLKQQVIALAEADGDIDWNAQTDSTVVRAHQHAAGARKGGSPRLNRRHAKALAVPGVVSPPRSTLWPTGAAGHSPR
jgi:transposase